MATLQASPVVQVSDSQPGICCSYVLLFVTFVLLITPTVVTNSYRANKFYTWLVHQLHDGGGGQRTEIEIGMIRYKQSISENSSQFTRNTSPSTSRP